MDMIKETRTNRDYSSRTTEVAKWAREQVKRQIGKCNWQDNMLAYMKELNPPRPRYISPTDFPLQVVLPELHHHLHRSPFPPPLRSI